MIFSPLVMVKFIKTALRHLPVKANKKRGSPAEYILNWAATKTHK